MKIIIPQKDLLHALMVGGSMAGKSKTLPILNCVNVSVKGTTMTINSYDGQNSITKIVGILESDGDTAFCVDCKDFTSLVRAIKDVNITLDIDDYNIRLVHKKGVQSLPLENAEEYPHPLVDESDFGFTVDAATLHGILSTARNFVQSNELRPQMASIFLGIGDGKMDFAATDGFSLFADCIDFDYHEEPKEATINLNAVSPLLDMLATASDANICIGERTMTFKTEDGVLTSTMSEYKYPNYKAILPTEHKIEVELDKSDMIDTLSRVMLTANKENCLVKLSTEGMNLNVVSEDFNTSKKSKESLFCNKSGDDITIGLKGTYLKTCLEQVRYEKVTLFMSHPSRPIIIKDEYYADRVIMLMPMQI